MVLSVSAASGQMVRRVSALISHGTSTASLPYFGALAMLTPWSLLLPHLPEETTHLDLDLRPG